MAEQSADDAAFLARESIRREEIGHDVVVVARVESDVVAAGFKDRADDVEGAVAVERRDFDGDEAGDVGEGTPEAVGKHPAADGGLQLVPDADEVARAAARLRDRGVQLRDTGAAVELDDPWGNLVRLYPA